MTNTVYVCSDPSRYTQYNGYLTKFVSNRCLSSKYIVDECTSSLVVSTTRGDVPFILKATGTLPNKASLGKRDQVVFLYSTDTPYILYEYMDRLHQLEENCRVYTVAVSTNARDALTSQVGTHLLENLSSPTLGDRLLFSLVRYILRSNSVKLQLPVIKTNRVSPTTTSDVPSIPTPLDQYSNSCIQTNRDSSTSHLERLNAIIRELSNLQSSTRVL